MDLLAEFEAIPPFEQQSFAGEVLCRARELPFDSGPIRDEPIGAAGRSLSAYLEGLENEPTAR